MQKRLEKVLYSLLNEQKDACFLTQCLRNLVLGALYCVSLLFKTAVECKELFYKNRKVIKKFPIPVISIGNIVAGGTGKTPLVYLLAELLKDWGKVAIVSRGYGSLAEKAKESLVIPKGAVNMTAKECGDEPLLLARRLEDALVIVGYDRERSIQKAVNLGANVVLLDDGMQKRGLYRDYNLVIVNGHNLFGNGFFLPRGYLRESPSSLNRAHVVIVNGAIEDNKAKIKENIRQFTEAPIVWGKVNYLTIEFLTGFVPELSDCHSLNFLNNKKIALFCGIGHPERFLYGVERLGCKVVKTLFLADHEEIDLSKIEGFSKAAKMAGAEIILCTEKDAVKISSEAIKRVELPLAFLPIHFEIQSDHNEWQDLMDGINNQMNKRTQV